MIRVLVCKIKRAVVNKMLENCLKNKKKKPMMDIDNKYKFIKTHECNKVFPHTLT